MKKNFFTTLICGLLCGCATNTQTGALAGAGIGAGTGALVTGTGAGALVGGGVGALVGTAVGASLDAQDRERLQEHSPATLQKLDHNEPLTISDIQEMSHAGLKDDVIIEQIHSTQTVFHLSASDIDDLQKAGVSQKVIDAMNQTAS